MIRLYAEGPEPEGLLVILVFIQTFKSLYLPLSTIYLYIHPHIYTGKLINIEKEHIYISPKGILMGCNNRVTEECLKSDLMTSAKASHKEGWLSRR